MSESFREFRKRALYDVIFIQNPMAREFVPGTPPPLRVPMYTTRIIAPRSIPIVSTATGNNQTPDQCMKDMRLFVLEIRYLRAKPKQDNICA